ncbi:MAG TPA: hypothetical protein VIX15_18640 [Streptosporangiaceae bacterium]
MKFKAIAVMVTGAALSLGLAGSALAAPLGMAKPAPQVTGSRLQSALLPASAFGDGLTVDGHLNTGNTLGSTHAFYRPSGLKCSTFQTYTFVGVFGDTAGATDGINNPNPAFGDYPNLLLAGDQAVLQFQTTQAAASFYNQAYARYRQCSAFTESPGTGDTLELTTQSLYSTTIDNNKAFQLIQYVDISSLASVNFYQNTAVALSGTNVYTIDILDGTNDPISASLMTNLIHRVQALYRHR